MLPITLACPDDSSVDGGSRLMFDAYRQLFSKILRTTDARALEAKKDGDQANKNQGRAQVMNLLTIDSGAIASLGIHAWNISNALINLLVGFWLLYSMLGISAIVGIACIPLLSSLTVVLAKFIYRKSIIKGHPLSQIATSHLQEHEILGLER
jgi:hypothetical protein